MTSERNAAADVILHIGAGSFHRAHQAWYLHRLIESGDRRWSATSAAT
jgi:D-arabinitol 4-dehydrogenase